jgi:C4-dicarboxylate-specific signal transduction histidine kinase
MMKSADSGYHSLLARQLKKHFPCGTPAEIAGFLADIDQAYREADQDRNMLERALDITSAEMMSVYENLKKDMERRIAVERELSDTKEKMLAAGKREALGHLAANIAHDFNNYPQYGGYSGG